MYLMYNYLITVKSPARLINCVMTGFENSGKLSPYWTYSVTWMCEKEIILNDG